MLTDGLKAAVKDLDPVEFLIPETGSRIAIWISDVTVSKPGVVPGAVGAVNKDVYPTEARQRGGSYKGRITVRAGYSVNGVTQPMLEKVMGNIPIMLRSLACHLHNLSPAELVERGEHEQEWGGYFIVGGHERILRMLQTTRRNYPVAMKRGSWKNRGKNFSDLGVLLECGKRDLTTTKNVLHFVTTGSAKYMFALNKELFFLPVMMLLKCLKDVSDSYIYKRLMVGAGDDPYYKGSVVNMLREVQEEGIFSHDQARNYIGRSFREKVKFLVPEWYTDGEVCDYLMRKCVAIHLKENSDKFDIIVVMVKKLFSLVQGKCVVEGADSLMMHEIVLGGHIYLQLIKEKIDDWMKVLKFQILRKAKMVGSGFDLTPQVVNWCTTKTGTLE